LLDQQHVHPGRSPTHACAALSTCGCAALPACMTVGRLGTCLPQCPPYCS
jgi:hypothetical protein